MSISEKVAAHQDEIMEMSVNIQDLMSKSTSGSAMMESSQKMAMSTEMQALMQTIDNPAASEQDKFLMGKYMGQLLQKDPENGLVSYANYLDSVANDPSYQDRKEYFLSIKKAAVALNNTNIFREYVKLYQAFEADKSQDAAEARKAMEQMSKKMQEWVGDEGNPTLN